MFLRSQIPCLTLLESPVVISWFHSGPSLERLSSERPLLRCTFRYVKSKKTNVTYLLNTEMIPINLETLDHQRDTFVCTSSEFWMLTQQILDSGAFDVFRSAYFIQMIKSWAWAKSVISPGVTCLITEFLSHCLLKTPDLLHAAAALRNVPLIHCLTMLSAFCFSTETICYHNIQQAHSGADGLSDRVSNDTCVRWIWTLCVNIIANKQLLHESRMRAHSEDGFVCFWIYES